MSVETAGGEVEVKDAETGWQARVPEGESTEPCREGASTVQGLDHIPALLFCCVAWESYLTSLSPWFFTYKVMVMIVGPRSRAPGMAGVTGLQDQVASKSVRMESGCCWSFQAHHCLPPQDCKPIVRIA